MQINIDFPDVAAALNNIAEALLAGVDESAAWRRMLQKIPKPRPFRITPVSERTENEMDIHTYRAHLPAVPEGTDIQSQTLAVTCDNEQFNSSQELATSATTGDFEVPEGSNVTVALTYVDNAGNASAPQSQSFVAADTIPPSAPGEMSFELVGERTVPDA